MSFRAIVNLLVNYMLFSDLQDIQGEAKVGLQLLVHETQSLYWH